MAASPELRAAFFVGPFIDMCLFLVSVVTAVSSTARRGCWQPSGDLLRGRDDERVLLTGRARASS